ncbi:Ppx/GppA phosphatase family protein [Fibrella aquatica]|jgi:exopolyphosphatase / guanosine-5'-triphosphate,3'-diphosphate pyrophosphatase|uniref:Ppx/GppA phosphatase family protein n=1 Tax=Fibrella aquatica TaxID=3242487 RepID=UPI00352063A4
MKQAVIDLGTNTFHLMIVQKKPDAARADADPGAYQTLFRESRPAKIGRSSSASGGGINQRIITDEAIERALSVLTYFRGVLDQHQIDPAEVAVYGTSAIRVAQNQQAFVDRVKQETGLQIRVISGDEEAGLIYKGVRSSGAIPADETAMVMDIGGGSVEFIIAGRDGNDSRIFWKQSFEIGGQRLMERFMGEADIISPASVSRMQTFFQEQLLPLTNAVHQYQPTVLVGSSGSFDTLVDMYFHEQTGTWPPAEQAAFTLPIADFYHFYQLLIERNHDQRMALPGMIELRVDMIVVAVCLIDFVLRSYGIKSISVSTYALKEGALV